MMFRIVFRPMFTAFKYLLLNCIIVYCLTSKYSKCKNISKCETKKRSCDITLRALSGSDKLNTASLYNTLLNAHARDNYNRKNLRYIVVIIVFRK